MSSSNAEHFFQTSDSIAEVERRRSKAQNSYGRPTKFPAKLLAISDGGDLDPARNTFYLAGADGQIWSYNPTSHVRKPLGRASSAPMTCLLSFVGEKSAGSNLIMGVVYGAGWNQYITAFVLGQVGKYDLTGLSQGSFKAHQDFVKCLCLARAADNTLVILSGAADGDLNVWKPDGTRLASLRPQSRGIECIVLDPLSDPAAPRIFFSTSQREIYSFILPGTSAMKKPILMSDPIIQHETSVYKILFDSDGDLWTASADKTAKRLVRENGFQADTTFIHPDFVRDIVLHEPAALAITACRDEEVRVWNTGTSQLMHVFTGHYEEVTGLVMSGTMLLSISIDATVRHWDLSPINLAKAIEQAKNPNPNLDEQDLDPKGNFTGITEEEEEALRAMMEDE